MTMTITLYNGAEVTARFDEANDIWTLSSGGRDIGWAREVPNDIEVARDFAGRAARAFAIDEKRIQQRLDSWGKTAWKLWPAKDDAPMITCRSLEEAAQLAAGPFSP